MCLKLWVTSPKVFFAEPIPTVCFRSQPPPHSRADDTADLSSVSHLAISPCSRRNTTRDARHSLSPAFDKEPRRDGIRSFLSPCHHRTGHRWQPSSGWLVCAKPTAPRRTVDVATNMSGPILFACTLLGVRVTCGVDPLLALRSRKSFKEIGVSLPQEEIRLLAPSFSCWCDTCLEHRGRASFGSQNAQGNGVLPHGPRPLWCLRKTETRHWVQSHLARRVLFSLGGETIYGSARPLSVPLLN